MVAAPARLLGFKRHLRPAVVPGEAAYLVSDRGVVLLRGRHFEVLAPLLDGSRTLEAVVRDAAPLLGADTVGAALGHLEQAELLAFREPEDGPRSPDDDSARAYWDLAGLDGERAGEAVSAAGVEVVTVAGAKDALVREACAGSGLALAEPGRTPAALTVVLTEDYLHPDLAALDRRQRELGRPWLLARPSGPDPWIGPLFRPDGGPCWRCLTDRLAGHRGTALHLSRMLGAAAPEAPAASLAAVRAVAAQLTALEAAKWLAGVRQAGQGALHTLDTLTLRLRCHPISRRPQCPDCGDAGLMAEQAWRPVAARTEGPRTEVPEPRDAAEVLARHRHLVGPLTGIVDELRPVPTPAGFVHLVRTGPNPAPSGAGLETLRAVLRQHSGGKGATAEEAKVGALGEAVERYSAGRQGDEAVVLGSYRELAGDAVHPDACQLYDRRQFERRDSWNATQTRTHWVCEPFDEDERREWTPVWSLTRRRHVLVPTALLYFHHGGRGSSAQILADSSGCAAGASPEDALLRGFLELAERDAVALWWYNRTTQPAVDLDAFADPRVDGMREACERLGRSVWALDLTDDLRVPAVVAVSAHLEGGDPRPLLGFGAHFDPRIAVRRAFAELGQLTLEHVPEEFGPADRTWPARQTGPAPRTGPAGPATPPALPGAGPREAGLAAWWSAMARTGEPEAYLLPAAGGGLGPDAYAHRPHPDPARRVQDVVGLLWARRLELLALDLTRPDVGMPVVRAMVPGLRPAWARFAPGRLFDIPVALGRLREPTPYHRLNPTPLCI